MVQGLLLTFNNASIETIYNLDALFLHVYLILTFPCFHLLSLQPYEVLDSSNWDSFHLDM